MGRIRKVFPHPFRITFCIGVHGCRSQGESRVARLESFHPGSHLNDLGQDRGNVVQ